MSYQVNFNFAGICILTLILFLYFTKKHLPIWKHRIFLALLVLELMLGILDSYLVYNGNSVEFTQNAAINVCFWISILYDIADLLLTLSYAYYCIICLKDETKLLHSLKIFLNIPILFGIGIVFAYVINVLCFHDMFVVFSCGKAVTYLLFAIKMYYLLLSGAYVYKHRKHLPVSKTIVIHLFFACVFLPIFMEIFLNQYHMGVFSRSIGLLMVLFLVQNPQFHIDGKTGLFNRDTLITMLKNRTMREKSFTVISIGVGDIKFLNNTFGIPFVDSMLKKVAQYLKRGFSKQAEVYQIAIGHFCLIIEDTEKTNHIVEAVLDRFSRPFSDDKIEVSFPLNICVIECPEDADTVGDIVEYIDETLTLERTKDETQVVYAKDLDINSSKRIKEVECAIERALKNDSFEVYYQPIYSTKEHRIVSAEALIRLFDDNLGFVSPEEFIPISEKNGKILKIGMFVFENVCRFISENNLIKRGIQYIEINLSVVQCMQKQLSQELLVVMKRYNIKGGQINLEITETAAAYSPEMLRINMRRLSDSGISFSLDDYGTGYSNMSYMFELPFNLVKLDKSIVWASFEKEKALIAMVGTIAMIKKLEMNIVAEGVETEEQVKLLSELGCDYLQGYYFSKPVPEQEFLKLLP